LSLCLCWSTKEDPDFSLVNLFVLLFTSPPIDPVLASPVSIAVPAPGSPAAATGVISVFLQLLLFVPQHLERDLKSSRLLRNQVPLCTLVDPGRLALPDLDIERRVRNEKHGSAVVVFLRVKLEVHRPNLILSLRVFASEPIIPMCLTGIIWIAWD
jgi:hypothetical protein